MADLPDLVNERLREHDAGPDGDEVFVYHGTHAWAAKRIHAAGALMPARTRGPVYLTTDIQAAGFYAAMWTTHFMSRHGEGDEGAVLCFSVPVGNLGRSPTGWNRSDEYILYGGLSLSRLVWEERGVLGVDLGRGDFRRAADYTNARIDAGGFGARCPAGCGSDKPRHAADVALSVATSHARQSEIHGLAHWGRVAVLAAHLSAREPAADSGVTDWFALLHDTQRVNDGQDPEHGQRAAAATRTLKALRADLAPNSADQNEARLDTLCEALSGHADGKVTDDPTIGVCWDADRLDLWRLGVEPDPRFLSTATARDPETIEFARDLQSMPINEWVAATLKIAGT